MFVSVYVELSRPPAVSPLPLPLLLRPPVAPAPSATALYTASAICTLYASSPLSSTGRAGCLQKMIGCPGLLPSYTSNISPGFVAGRPVRSVWGDTHTNPYGTPAPAGSPVLASLLPAPPDQILSVYPAVVSLHSFWVFPPALQLAENSFPNSSGSIAYTGCPVGLLRMLPAIRRLPHDSLYSPSPPCRPLLPGQTGSQTASVLFVTSVFFLFWSCYLCSNRQCQPLRSTAITQFLHYYGLVRAITGPWYFSLGIVAP